MEVSVCILTTRTKYSGKPKTKVDQTVQINVSNEPKVMNF